MTLASAARRVADAACGSLLAIVLAITLMQVVARYVLGWAMPWSEELVRLVFVWMVMVAAAGSAHMQIDFFVERFTPRIRLVTQLCLSGLSAALLGLMAWKSVGMIDLTRDDQYAALGVSVQYLYWAVLVGASAWLVQTAWTAVASMRSRSH